MDSSYGGIHQGSLPRNSLGERSRVEPDRWPPRCRPFPPPFRGNTNRRGSTMLFGFREMSGEENEAVGGIDESVLEGQAAAREKAKGKRPGLSTHLRRPLEALSNV